MPKVFKMSKAIVVFFTLYKTEATVQNIWSISHFNHHPPFPDSYIKTQTSQYNLRQEVISKDTKMTKEPNKGRH